MDELTTRRNEINYKIDQIRKEIDNLSNAAFDLNDSIKKIKPLRPMFISAVVPVAVYCVSNLLVFNNYLTGEVVKFMVLSNEVSLNSIDANTLASIILSLPISAGITFGKVYDKYVSKQELEKIRKSITDFKLMEGSLLIELDDIQNKIKSRNKGE